LKVLASQQVCNAKCLNDGLAEAAIVATEKVQKVGANEKASSCEEA
jgi:hypothetical protein